MWGPKSVNVPAPNKDCNSNISSAATGGTLNEHGLMGSAESVVGDANNNQRHWSVSILNYLNFSVEAAFSSGEITDSRCNL